MVGMTLPYSAIVRTGSHTKKKGCLGSRAVPRSDAPTPILSLTLCERVPLSVPPPPDFVRLEWHMLFVAGVVPTFCCRWLPAGVVCAVLALFVLGW